MRESILTLTTAFSPFVLNLNHPVNDVWGHRSLLSVLGHPPVILLFNSVPHLPSDPPPLPRWMYLVAYNLSSYYFH